jgi:hypothetical protein
MLHSFRVRFSNIWRNTHGRKQCNHKPVSGANPFGKFKTGLRKEDAPIRSRRCQPLTLQTCDALQGGWMGDTKPPSNIGRPSLSVRSQQIGDELDVVL